MPRIDANVVLRYLTDEPAEQAVQVARLFDRAAAELVTLTVDEIVVAEVVWTLKSHYHLERAAITEVMLQFLAADGIECRNGSAVLRALVLMGEKNVDFADALVCARMLDEGEVELYSFDRELDRVEGIRRLEPG
ncbi:MAG TPA: PIN domain-containing protein [Chloroflexota bacterium]